jgi:hypothetical protein
VPGGPEMVAVQVRREDSGESGKALMPGVGESMRVRSSFCSLPRKVSDGGGNARGGLLGRNG